MGANILLAHFHYLCKGNQVFEQDGKIQKTKSMANLNTEQVQFVQKTAAHVKANRSQFAEILNENLIEHEHYFIAQLYESDWKPRFPVF